MGWQHRKDLTPWNKGKHIATRPRTLYEQRNCRECQSAIFTYPSQDKRFCSRSCRSKFNSRSGMPWTGKKTGRVPRSAFTPANTGGANHPNWRGGITPQSHRERNRFQKYVAPIVMKRDGRTCQFCGVRGTYMHVDHIKPWAKYPELRFDPMNCRTLCMRCHYKVTFGKELAEGMHWGGISRRAVS